jgi:hypothetical protein
MKMVQNANAVNFYTRVRLDEAHARTHAHAHALTHTHTHTLSEADELSRVVHRATATN